MLVKNWLSSSKPMRYTDNTAMTLVLARHLITTGCAIDIGWPFARQDSWQGCCVGPARLANCLQRLRAGRGIHRHSSEGPAMLRHMADTATQRAMNAILDMVVAYDENATEEQNDTAVQTAFANLNEVGAISAIFDDETDVVTLEVTPLLTAIGVTVDTLIRQLATERGHDRLTILNVLREHLDGVLSDDD
jgi:hypothetical protein